MMAGQSPAYLWYPKDMLSSGRVAALSPLEELWYRRALEQSWLSDGLPADPDEFAGYVGRGCTAEAAVKLIARFFVPHRKDATKIVNPRLEQERKNLQRKSALRTKAGIESGRKRRANSRLGDEHMLNKTRTNEEQNTNIPIAIATPIAIPKKEEDSPTATPSVKARAPRPKSAKADTDPRVDHPAITAVREVTRAFPLKQLWDTLIEVLGDEPDRAKMKECYLEWISRGSNKMSIKPFTEWYVEGIPTHHKANGTRTDQNIAAGFEALRRAEEQERSGEV